MSAPRETRVSAPRKVAVVGLGEVGTVFARALQAQGVAVAVASRDNPRAAQAAEALGLPLVPLAEAASGAEIVLVTVTGESMPAVTAHLVPHLATGALVADCTAAAPLQVRGAAEGVGRGFVDVAIMGAVSLHGRRRRSSRRGRRPGASPTCSIPSASGSRPARRRGSATPRR